MSNKSDGESLSHAHPVAAAGSVNDIHSIEAVKGNIVRTQSESAINKIKGKINKLEKIFYDTIGKDEQQSRKRDEPIKKSMKEKEDKFTDAEKANLKLFKEKVSPLQTKIFELNQENEKAETEILALNKRNQKIKEDILKFKADNKVIKQSNDKGYKGDKIRNDNKNQIKTLNDEQIKNESRVKELTKTKVENQKKAKDSESKINELTSKAYKSYNAFTTLDDKIIKNENHIKDNKELDANIRNTRLAEFDRQDAEYTRHSVREAKSEINRIKEKINTLEISINSKGDDKDGSKRASVNEFQKTVNILEGNIKAEHQRHIDTVDKVISQSIENRVIISKSEPYINKTEDNINNKNAEQVKGKMLRSKSESDINKTKGKIDQLEKEFKDQISKDEKQSKKRDNVIKKNIKVKETEFLKLEKKNLELFEEKVSPLQIKISKLNEKNEEAKTKISSFQKEIDSNPNNQKQNKKNEHEINKLNKSIKTNQEEVEKLESKINTLTSEVYASYNRFTELNDAMIKDENQIKDNKERLDTNIRNVRIAEFSRKVEEVIDKNIDILESEINIRKKEINELNMSIHREGDKKNKKHIQVNALQDRIMFLEESINAEKQRHIDVVNEIKTTYQTKLIESPKTEPLQKTRSAPPPPKTEPLSDVKTGNVPTPPPRKTEPLTKTRSAPPPPKTEPLQKTGNVPTPPPRNTEPLQKTRSAAPPPKAKQPENGVPTPPNTRTPPPRRSTDPLSDVKTGNVPPPPPPPNTGPLKKIRSAPPPPKTGMQTGNVPTQEELNEATKKAAEAKKTEQPQKPGKSTLFSQILQGGFNLKKTDQKKTEQKTDDSVLDKIMNSIINDRSKFIQDSSDESGDEYSADDFAREQEKLAKEQAELAKKQAEELAKQEAERIGSNLKNEDGVNITDNDQSDDKKKDKGNLEEELGTIKANNKKSGIVLDNNDTVDKPNETGVPKDDKGKGQSL